MLMIFLKELLSETGSISTLRLMSLISLLTGVSVAFIGLFMNKDLTQTATLAGVFIGAAFMGKVGQKLTEK